MLFILPTVDMFNGIKYSLGNIVYSDKNSKEKVLKGLTKFLYIILGMFHEKSGLCALRFTILHKRFPAIMPLSIEKVFLVGVNFNLKSILIPAVTRFKSYGQSLRFPWMTLLIIQIQETK